MTRRFFLLILSLILILSFTVTATDLKEAEVLEVYDGNTIRVRIDKDQGILNTSLRYIGIDTPEIHGGVEYYGREATNYNKELVGGKTVWVKVGEKEQDKYGRLLAHVYLDSAKKSLVSAILAAQGYAEVMTIPPNDKYAGLLTELVNEAREGKRGQWAGKAEMESSWQGTEDPVVDKAEPVEGADNCIEVLNKATQEDFEDISGIGEGVAERLINAQPFGPCNSLGCIETNLMEVSYVGKGRANDLLEHFCPEIAE